MAKRITVHTLLYAITVLILATSYWVLYNSAQQTNAALGELPFTITAPVANAQRIVAVGDVVCDTNDLNFAGHNHSYCQSDKTFVLAKNAKPDAILGLGDLQYENGSLEKFQNNFAKSWGNLGNIFYPSPGNHEYATPGAAGYYQYFKTSRPQTEKGYYSFNLGGWHVISLNSNCEKIGGCQDDSPQLQWLKQDLAANKKSARWLSGIIHVLHLAGTTMTQALQNDLGQCGRTS